MKNKDNNPPKVKQRLLLPIISLILCLIPALLWGLAFFFNLLGISSVAYVIWVLLLVIWFGIFFYGASAVVGVIYILSQVSRPKNEQLNIKGLVVASFSVILSSVLFIIFIQIIVRGP